MRASNQHPKGHGALARVVVPGRPRPGMPIGGADGRKRSWTARRPSADLPFGGVQPRPRGTRATGTPRAPPRAPAAGFSADGEGGESKGPRDLQVERRGAPVARAREGPQAAWRPSAKNSVGRPAREAEFVPPQGEIYLPAQPTLGGEV